jgi:rhodanese-related sulfurtransferase
MFSWTSAVVRALLLVVAALLVGLVFNHTSPKGIGLGDHPLEAVSNLESTRFLRTLAEAESKWKAGMTFVDARDELFYEQGHIPRAVSLPVLRFEEAFARVEPLLAKDETIVCYCSGFGCEESTELAERLIEKGYRDVYVYEGGWPEWSASGLPVEPGDNGGRDE